ncbi:MAG: hypothetical protein O2956_11600 [Gemmatimonadetes bacterium]|nr:hypothetical protein [Gemmatimonadota bacterium]
MRRTLFLFLAFAVSAVSLEAQADRQTGFMVHQLSVCPGPNMARINELSAVGAPILNALKEEGMIRDWYDLRHGWGDEWNVGMVTIAASHRAWLDFWAEYLRRLGAAQPGVLAEYGSLCTLHKDNMYSVRNSGSL